MKKYNLLFDDDYFEFCFKQDISKCVEYKMGFNPIVGAEIAYKIYQGYPYPKLKIIKQTQLTKYNEIPINDLLWDSFIPHIPKHENTCLLSSSPEFWDQTLRLAAKLNYDYYSIDYYPNNYYDNNCIIGDINSKMINPNERNIYLYTISLSTKQNYDIFNSVFTMNVNRNYKYKNITKMDTSSILADIIYNDFYQIGK